MPWWPAGTPCPSLPSLPWGHMGPELFLRTEGRSVMRRHAAVPAVPAEIILRDILPHTCLSFFLPLCLLLSITFFSMDRNIYRVAKYIKQIIHSSTSSCVMLSREGWINTLFRKERRHERERERCFIISSKYIACKVYTPYLLSLFRSINGFRVTI